VGEGIPHRFDLQFVREGTNVVLGSIPVVLGTPIPGDGYEFEDLEEGEYGEDVSFGSHHGSLPPNTAPSFVGGADEMMAEDAGSQTVVGWATSISPGAEIEAWQQVEFVVSNDNTALFATPPAISPSGTLTYAPAANASGTAVVTVVLRDNGGTDDGGVDASNPQTFTITVTPVNDPPQAASDAYEVYLNGSLVVPAQGVLGNDADVDDTSFSAVLETGPASGTLALNADGSFTYTPVTWFSGADSFTYRATDGTATSGLATATITVRWLTGDLNADGNVDRSDVALLVNGFGSTATRPGGDLDDDGIVGLTDVSLMSEHLGMQYPPPTPSAAASSSAVTRLGPRDAGEARNGTLVANRARHRRGTALSSAAVDAAVATGDPWSHRLQTTRMCRVAMR
jgi:VCBS repeat-containing protein